MARSSAPPSSRGRERHEHVVDTGSRPISHSTPRRLAPFGPGRVAPSSRRLGDARALSSRAGRFVLALSDGHGERHRWCDTLSAVNGGRGEVGAATTSGVAVVTRVLLLNATFEPLQLVSERRAVVLMLAGRAEPIVTPEHPSVCRSASVVVEIPAIVRLHDMVKLPLKVRTPPLTRRSLLLRDSYRCAYCLEHADTIDHVVPRSRGGRHEWTNVVAACRHHNMQKGDRLLEEIGWRMHFEPRVPDGPWWRWRHLPDPDPLWAPYLPRAS